MTIINLLEHNRTAKALTKAGFNEAYNIVCAFHGLSHIHTTYSKVLTIRAVVIQPYLYMPMKIVRSKIFK